MRSRRGAPTGLILFALIALAASAGFVRLGFWQLERHREVNEETETRAARLALEPVPLRPSMLVEDSVSALAGRRVSVSGSWEFEREVVIRSRARSGTPGVHIVTPLRLDPTTDDPGAMGPSVLVLRGWLGSPAATGVRVAETGRAPRLGDDATRLALVRESRTGHGGPMVELDSEGGAISSYAAIDVEMIAREADESAPFFLQLLPVARSDDDPPEVPFPVPLPTPGAGPHMSYAIQWFSFALITLVGSVAFLRRESRRRG